MDRQTENYVAHVTDAADIVHRVEIPAASRQEAMRAALASVRNGKRVSCRDERELALVRQRMRERLDFTGGMW